MTLDMTDQAYVFFVQESLELMQILEQGLITLSQEHDLSKLHSLMRAAHSIKGGAACVGLDGIQQIAHELENGIRALYPGDTVFDEELEDLMLKGFDCLRLPLTEQIETGICDDVTALALAQPIFRQIETKIGCSLEEAAELPEVPMQTDMTLFLFQEEVPSGLRRLASLIHQHPQPTDLIAELTSQLEVLGTFGSMLNLIGFSAIANTALKALQVNPDQAVNIIELALSDFWAGQQAVLLGDRIQGGQPVAALFELTRADLSPGEFAPRSSIEPTMAEELTRDELTSITEALAGFDLDALEGFSEVEFPEEDLPDLSEDEPSNESFEGRVVEAEPSTVISIEPLKTASNQMFQSSSPANPQSVETQTKPDQTSTRLGIRIDLNRLEKINTLVGELTTQDNAFLLRNQQNQTAVETLSKTWQKFKKLVVQLQGLTDIDPMLEFTQDLYQSSTRTSQSSSHGLAHLLNQVGLSPELLTKTLEDAEQLDKILYDMRLSSLQGQQLLKKRQTTLHQVQKQLTETRMVSVATLLERFPRMLRDLSRQKQKPVKLEITGQDTLIDQVILEKLYDPLVHVVRNAFEHGIEPGDIRRAQGKSEQGTIQVKAYHQGNYTYLEIQDDGQGINLDKVRAKAVRQGLVSHSDAHKLSTAKLYDLLFIPGFFDHRNGD
ncbi:MAG: hypothetical protein HC825_04565 [Oscillatoriales cyanobacterium RM1_1_9]|nr:hypothetical protein [Oscillatoriales cyanobacterium RM1_1_9]